MTATAANPTATLRRENLVRLITEYGSAADLARATGKDRRQVSAWITGTKKISDESARELERETRKPSGWMDREQTGASPTVHSDLRSQSHLQRLDPSKLQDAMTLLRHLAELRDVPELVNDPVSLALAYEVIVAIDTPLTNDNVLDITKRLAVKLRGNGDATGERDAAA